MSSSDREKGLATDKSSNAVSIDHLIGSVVRTRDGNQEVGTLEDILTDSNGSPIVAVISMGEFLGIGQKDVAVDWGNITVVPDNESRTATSPADGADAANQNSQSGNNGDQHGSMDEFHEPDGYSILVNMTEQTLKDAPEFERTWD